MVQTATDSIPEKRQGTCRPTRLPAGKITWTNEEDLSERSRIGIGSGLKIRYL